MRAAPQPVGHVMASTVRLFVVPCGRAKAHRPAPARQLYTSAHFRFVLAGVERTAGLAGGPVEVRVLSALHGLVNPDDVLEPYDLTMADPGSIDAERLGAQLAALAHGAAMEVDAYLPRIYLARLVKAAELTGGCAVHDRYAGCRGIGDQRQVIAGLPAPGA